MKPQSRQKKVVRRAFPKERKALIGIIREQDEQVASLQQELKKWCKKNERALREQDERVASLQQEIKKWRKKNERLIREHEKQTASLQQEIERWRKRNERLTNRAEQTEGRLREANRQIEELRQKLEEAQRAAHRQAAPFRRPESKRKTDPKRPGRAKGHPGVCRPKPDHIDDRIEVPLLACPRCGGPVHDVESVEQFIEDVPVMRSYVTHLVTYVGQCAHCGEDVRSTHPLQVSTATLAAGTHLGPRAQAVAISLNQPHGLSTRRTCRVLKDFFGLSITAGGLVQIKHRAAGKLQAHYDALLEQARLAYVNCADETSWYVGSPKWWLWVLTRDDLTYYTVRDSRARAVILDLLGDDYKGVLVSDCLSIYDLDDIVQQKCYAHHHKAISDAARRHPEGETPHLRALRDLLRAAQQFKNDMPKMDRKSVRSQRHKLNRLARKLILPTRTDPVEEYVTHRLRKQLDHLFTFLDHPDVPATNNLAERQLRPAVIARKISCGNRTPAGARTWEILASLAATSHQRGASFLDLLDKTARLVQPP